jgi:hypothetical protein
MQQDSSGWLDVEKERECAEQTQEQKFKRLLGTVRVADERFVFFLDNTDELISGRKEQDRKFINFLEEILAGSDNVKVLLTCRDVIS